MGTFYIGGQERIARAFALVPRPLGTACRRPLASFATEPPPELLITSAQQHKRPPDGDLLYWRTGEIARAKALVPRPLGTA